MAGSSVFLNPLASPLLLFLIQLALTLLLTRLLGKAFSYLKQPQVIGEIVAGVVLGPSVLGRIPGFTEAVWPTEVYITPTHYYDSVQTFYVVANVGLILFMFIMGMELDQGLIKAQWRAALPIAVGSIAFPFAVGSAVAPWLHSVNNEGQPPEWQPPSMTAFVLFSGASMSFTAFPVLASLLASNKLLGTPLGTQAMSCAAIDDILAWCTLAVASSFAKNGAAINGLYTCLAATVYVLVMALLLRPSLKWFHHRMEAKHLTDNRYYLCFIFMLLIASSFTTEVIGIHSFFGAFVLGLFVPKSNGFADKLIPQMELVVVEVLLPLFFACSGIRTNIGTLDSWRLWGITLAIIIIACVAKFTPGCLLTRLLSKRSWRFSVAMGLLMNTRGLVEIIALNVGLSMGLLSPRLFTMLIIMAIATTLITAPTMYYVYIRPTRAGQQLPGHLGEESAGWEGPAGACQCVPLDGPAGATREAAEAAGPAGGRKEGQNVERQDVAAV